MDRIISIAIDGPAGAGKSTVAKAVASRLGAMYLDTGAMYRATGLYMQRIGVSLSDTQAVIRHIEEVPLRVVSIDSVQHTFLGDEDVSLIIRTAEATKASSAVSAIAEVRAHLVEMQRDIARGQSVVMDGRDIGTKVLPDATLKVFLTASPEVRARRRWQEMRNNGVQESLEKVLQDLMERDHNDSHRAASPMVRAEDAIEVDTSDMTFSEVVERIAALAAEAAGGRA